MSDKLKQHKTVNIYKHSMIIILENKKLTIKQISVIIFSKYSISHKAVNKAAAKGGNTSCKQAFHKQLGVTPLAQLKNIPSVFETSLYPFIER